MRARLNRCLKFASCDESRQRRESDYRKAGTGAGCSARHGASNRESGRPRRRVLRQRGRRVCWCSWLQATEGVAPALEQMRRRCSSTRVEYQEFPVPEALRRHVQCIWRLVDERPQGVQTIYPDGRCELIAQLGGQSRLWDAVDGWHLQSQTLFAAQRVTAVRFEPIGRLDDIGVRLQPAASSLITRELAAMRDRVVDLAGIDRGTSRSLDTAARAFVAGKSEPLWRLLSRLCDAHHVDSRTEAAVARLIGSDGRARIDTIARAASLSVRPADAVPRGSWIEPEGVRTPAAPAGDVARARWRFRARQRRDRHGILRPGARDARSEASHGLLSRPAAQRAAS